MTPHGEKAASLAFAPVFTTLGFYFLPLSWQSDLLIQCIPQLMAYLALGCWIYQNGDRRSKLGLASQNIQAGVGWGTIIGIVLGCINTAVILYVVPTLGKDIDFLRQTPHALIPFWIMVPWFIIIIAMVVELNFRGFVLGRLLTVFSHFSKSQDHSTQGRFLATVFPLGISALTFSFDPFMVATFRHLHWIAVWDGIVWGVMWIRKKNLYAVITAHAIEVIIVYLLVRAALT